MRQRELARKRAREGDRPFRAGVIIQVEEAEVSHGRRTKGDEEEGTGDRESVWVCKTGK